ncbi:MAG: hypothetical protein QF565_07405 [Arenicellales bacterium]|jgi:ABC-type transport system involved in multi-copper enzyme maturation permease subunit|nr:hypothetical protein [Arenicellales bacterium]HJN52388.1 hypothetical protein [Pseudomonadales bacterium]
MMRLATTLAIARAEIRSVRRLARYWVFTFLAVLMAILVYLEMAVVHALFSRISATIGYVGPRYMVSAVGMYLLLFFLIGLVFIAYDVRARDERERMIEVLDSRPITNAEFLLGRCLALVLMTWLPVLLIAIFLQLFGLLSLWNGWTIGDLIEPYSLMGFLLQTLTSLTLWCVIVVLLAMLVRNRLLVALVALALLGLQFWILFQLPVYLQPIVSLFPTFDAASDLIPKVIDDVRGIHYVALWMLAAGILTMAIAVHPRPDGGSTSHRIALGGGLLVISAALLAFELQVATAALAQRSDWLAAHQQYRDAPSVDIVAIAGLVRIDPGRQLSLDLDMRVRGPAERESRDLIFTLNPGLVVERVTTDGNEASWTHDSGLLVITPTAPLSGGTESMISMQASGLPDPAFGYLDSAFDWKAGSLMDSQIIMLGSDISFFTPQYVTLMPGNRWLPSAGSDVPLSDPRIRPEDFYAIDLEVEIPNDWLVAGPGRRQVVDSATENARFRFHPSAPVPAVGLFASRFERRVMNVAGVELELLLHPAHDRNLSFFADTTEVLNERLEELLTRAANLGLPYPYGCLTLVETPNRLRGYGGGWRMDTIHTLPGVLLLRESSFPTSRFEIGFQDPDDFADQDGGVAAAKLQAIERFFENDFSGGNLFTGVSRNFLRFQTGASGEGSLAMNFVLDELVSQLLTEKRGYFSAHEFTRQSIVLVGQTVTDMLTGKTDSIAEAITRIATNRPSVWDRALGASLADLEPNDDPKQSLNVLALKGSAIARAILDDLGSERTGQLLAGLLRRFQGRNFTWSDLQQVAADLNIELDSILGDWLHDSALPGFLASSVKVVRLMDDEYGNPRYQSRVHVRNDEAVPGLFRLRYTTGDLENIISHHTEPHRVPGNQSVEIGLLSSTQPYEVWLQPYLSLNRRDIELLRPDWKGIKTAIIGKGTLGAGFKQVIAAPFLGSQPSTWRPVQSADIVVDDLDPGFSVNTNRIIDSKIGGAVGELYGLQVDLDQGMPVFHLMFGPPQVWSRAEERTSWGKYRQTFALITSGEGSQRVTFAASLPASGNWRLAYHVPEVVGQPRTEIYGKGSQGKYTLSLIANGESRSLEFDGAAAESGWNGLGEFYLSEGEVRLEVSDKTAGRVVIADAIRWRAVPKDR